MNGDIQPISAKLRHVRWQIFLISAVISTDTDWNRRDEHLTNGKERRRIEEKTFVNFVMTLARCRFALSSYNDTRVKKTSIYHLLWNRTKQSVWRMGNKERKVVQSVAFWNIIIVALCEIFTSRSSFRWCEVLLCSLWSLKLELQSLWYGSPGLCERALLCTWLKSYWMKRWSERLVHKPLTFDFFFFALVVHIKVE